MCDKATNRVKYVETVVSVARQMHCIIVYTGWFSHYVISTTLDEFNKDFLLVIVISSNIQKILVLKDKFCKVYSTAECLTRYPR